ncbi:Scr1 family TA system antitoxin-like transcriptional regulator [Actinomadura adrarensis]|uniref:Scr1 family TA system antitoxin-like transcriptional regulator n=1 Tax=Actinomadura adrarensis TaxID=1819600 RepID=A0ABW3CRX4_9ACTN
MLHTLRAVVALGELRGNPYFTARAAELFAQTVYLPARPDAAGLKEALDGFDVVIVGARARITSDLLTEATRAQIVGTLSIGTDHLDMPALEQRDIKVFNSPTANVRAVAEHNVALAFALAKRLKDGDLATLPDQRQVVYTDNAYGGESTTNPDHVAMVNETFAMLQGESLNVRDTQALIRKALKERWT